MRTNQPVVYIMASETRTLYVGVTSDLYTRVWQHKFKDKPGSFTARYGCSRLVFYAENPRMDDAIAYEKFLKGKSRAFKIALIEEQNPRWNDLAWNWFDEDTLG